MRTAEETAAIRQRLKEIEEAGGGRLTPDAVVKDAKRKDSPLHSCFEWDVKKASAAHWIDQARQLIVSVRVVVTTDTTSVKSVYYIHDPRMESGKQGYISVRTVRADAELARETLIAEFGRVADMLRRARELASVLDASDDVENLLQSVIGLRQRFAEGPAAPQ